MYSRRRQTTAALIDGILKFVAGGGFLTTALIAPNATKLLDKPMAKLMKDLDKRSRAREIKRVTYYMKQQGLIAFMPRDYEHGIVITAAGRRRLKNRDYETLKIPRQAKWDKKWRLVFFDIPETEKTKRDAFSHKLRLLGLQQLQKSIWIHPFYCRDEISKVTETLGISNYITYVEISQMDREAKLKQRFKYLIV